MPDAAFDATADALVRQALATLPAGRPHGRADLARLPGPVARLLTARLDAALAAAVPTTPVLDADDARTAAAAWHKAAHPAARYPADTWEAALRDAVRDALTHLVRPAAALADAATAGAPGGVRIATALSRMRAFGPYPYFPEILGRYAERKGLDTIDRDGLARLLRRIHRRMVAQFGPDEWMLLLGPLFALAGPVGQPTGAVPAALVRPLVPPDGPDLGTAPLQLADLREKLAPPPPPAPPDDPPEADRPPDDGASPPTLRPDLRAGRRVATSPPVLTPPPLPPVAEGVRPPVIGSRLGTPEESLDDDSAVLGPPRPVADGPPAPQEDALGTHPPDDPEPLWKQLATARDATTAPAVQAASDAEAPLWQRFATDAPPEAPEPPTSAPPDAEPPAAIDPPDAVEARVLGPAVQHRDWFVADLFGGDAEAYRATLARLDAASTYTAATGVISDDIFRAYRVNPYTEASVAFTDAVQAQYDRP